MSIFDFFNAKSKPSTEIYDQGVIIELPLEGTEEELQSALSALEEQIKGNLPEGGHIDGHELGDSEAIIYIYGYDANTIWEKIEPIMKRSEFNRVEVALQYGLPDDPNTKEKRFTVN